ncbi:MAG: glutathione peroxidase [Breznakibacter sp.]
MKQALLSVAFFVLFAIGANAQSDFYSFKVKTLEGDDFDFASLKGKKVMVVNTASKCGLTPQYQQMEAIYKKYGPDKFVIVGFPANNFGNQEPGTADEIAEFCSQNYGVSFIMLEKISVKGNDIHPVYQWLTSKAKNGVQDSEVQWNFQKYLISPAGVLEKVVAPRTKPDAPEVIAWIEAQ